MARRAARRAGIDPALFERQIERESGFNPSARSPAGATGIAQFMPGTAAGLGINPNDPRQALNAAARLMARYIRQYGGWEQALRAYNAGPGNIERSRGFRETNEYVRAILGGGGSSGAAGGGGGGRRVSGRGAASAVVESRVPIDVSSSGAALSALAQALERPAPEPMFAGVPMSEIAAQAPLPEGFRPVQVPARVEPSAQDFTRLLVEVAQAGRQQEPMTATVRGRGRASVSVEGRAGSGGGDRGGRLRDGGGWGGTEGIVRQFDRIAGQVGAGVGSGKRSYVPPGGSSTSDHLTGNKNAFARDYTGSEEAQRALAKRIADALGVRHTFRGADTNVTKVINGRKYRFQLITRPHGTGPHVHLGVRRIG